MGPRYPVAALLYLVYKAAMRTLATKLGFERRQFQFGKRGAVIVLVVCAIFFTLNVIFAFDEPLDPSNLSMLFLSAAFILFAVAELSHDAALEVAVLIRLAGASSIVVGVVFSITDIYLFSGPLLAAAFVSFILLVVVVVIYLQRRLKE